MSFCWFYIPFLCSHYIPMFFVKSLISIYGKSSPELFPAESPKDTISYCWSYPAYPSLSRFSWCYPTNCCIKWPFSIIDIPCYGCSRNLSSVETPRDARCLPMESCPQQGTDGACNSIRWGWHPLGGPQGYISGKRLHNYGKSSCYSWGEKKRTKSAIFNSKLWLKLPEGICLYIYLHKYVQSLANLLMVMLVQSPKDKLGGSSRQRHPGNCRDPKQPQLMGREIYIYICIYTPTIVGRDFNTQVIHDWLVVHLPLWKKWKSMGRTILYIMENKKWLKPPTRW